MKPLPNPPDFPLPSDDELRAESRAQHEARKAEIAQDPMAFPAVSLEAWLEVFRDAHVPRVPGKRIFCMPREVILRSDEPEPSDEALWASLYAALDDMPADHMARWDCCAESEVKYQMGMPRQSGGCDDAFRQLSPQDPRAFDIIYEYPSDEVPVLSRPWIAARQQDGFPVEFRVFIRENCIQGIASYYPQRPLPASADILGFVEKARTLSAKVLDTLLASGRYPWMPGMERRFARGKVHCTLDVLVTANDEVLFLEAGPPFGAGAHPCAFLGRESVEGVALELAPGVRLD